MKKLYLILIVLLVTCLLLVAYVYPVSQPTAASAHYVLYTSDVPQELQDSSVSRIFPAMISPAYRLDWYTPLTTNSGAPVASTHYKADFSLGQVAWGDYASPTYKAHTGYWAGIPYTFGLKLPFIRR